MELSYEYKQPNALQMKALQDALSTLKEAEMFFYLPLYAEEIMAEDKRTESVVAVKHQANSGAIEALVLCSFEVDENCQYLPETLMLYTLTTEQELIKQAVSKTVALSAAEILDFQRAQAGLLGAQHIPIAKLIQEKEREINYLCISKIVVPNSQPFAQFLLIALDDMTS